MKILQINNRHERVGGADIVYFKTADLLEKNGHTVYFFSNRSDGMEEYVYSHFFPKKIDYRNTSFITNLFTVKSFIRNKHAAIKLKEYIEYVKPDIAHLHLYLGGLSTSILDVLKSKSVPIVCSVHDYRLICPSYLFIDGHNNICERCKGGKFYNCMKYKCSENKFSQSMILSVDSYYRKYTKKIRRNIDRYIFVSNFSKEKHIEFSIDDPSKMDTLYNFMPNVEDVTPQDKKGGYFIYYGRISREKGLVNLVTAFKKTNLKLKIVGTGPLIHSIAKADCENIEFLRYKSGSELERLVRNSSFVVVPSEWYENNPMTIIEGLSYGKPVIGANIGGIPELIEHTKSGFMFESKNVDELRSFIYKADSLSHSEYKQMSFNARSFALKKFHPTVHYEKLMMIYEKALKQRS